MEEGFCRQELTKTAEAVLQRRYYRNGEDWEKLCLRVAKFVDEGRNHVIGAEKFFDIIYHLKFLPNSPCLMNAGTDLGQLSACFVLPVEDNLDGIFTSIRNGALVHKTGGGTGYSFSRLRPKNAAVHSTNGVASGPISFAKVFDVATDVIKQGGKRRGANMGVLRVDHPDILEFIDCKRDKGALTNFNLSVALTDGFMEAVRDGGEYDLKCPVTGNVTATLRAAEVFDRIVDAAWDNGEPGVLFIDTANRANPTPWLGEFEATNPCGEQWLLPYESCNLGSINLGKFVHVVRGHDGLAKDVDWDSLKSTVEIAVCFLDAVVDKNVMPLQEIAEATQKTRKIGLGIMGLHDMLIRLGIPYASEAGRKKAGEVMRFIHDKAEAQSERLATTCGSYPAQRREHWQRPMRNAALTSIQPTGTTSMIADCSSGCEPYFALVSRKNVMDGESFLMVNPLLENVLEERGLRSDALLEKIAERGTIVGIDEVPQDIQELFRCAQDISVDDHILMQAELQRSGVDSSISKTINMPNGATREDVKRAYMMGWELGCKGLTVYRDGCRDEQVLTAGAGKTDEKNGKEPALVKKALPDIVSAKRYRLKDREGCRVYVIICFDEDGNPVEVFAKLPFENRVDGVERSTMWTVICRNISLALRYGVPVEEIIRQLDKSSGHLFDLPAQLSKILKTFASKTRRGYKAGVCPECGVETAFQEGCTRCPACGWSKCA